MIRTAWFITMARQTVQTRQLRPAQVRAAWKPTNNLSTVASLAVVLKHY